MTGYELYQIAKKHIGEGGAKARAYCGMSGGAWCNAYVCYIFGQGKVANLFYGGKRVTYCPTSIKWCEAHLAQIPIYLAMPMDVIYFDWQPNGRPDHIGFVKARKSSSEVFTHEGNTSGGRVAEKTRPIKYIEGVFRPHFKPKSLSKKKLELDGAFDYQSIYIFQLALGLKGDGILGKATVKAWQKKIGVTPDGAWGRKTTLAAQKFLKIKQDGAWGKSSTIALQKWCNKKVFPQPSGNGVATSPTVTKPTTPKKTPKKYSGEFPALPPKTAKYAVECAYAYGTKKSVYKYKGGKPKGAYKTLLNKMYPNRKGWKYAKSRAGASCDVFAGTVLKASGYKSAPHAMSKMVAWCKKHLKKGSTKQNGDILTRTNHVMVYLSLKGKGYVANAHFQTDGGTYGIIQGVGKYTNIWRPTGVSYFSKGDTFTDVKKLQKFLNWYGNYGLKEDYVFNTKTENAVKDFQKKEGLKVDGIFGKTCLDKARTVKK